MELALDPVYVVFFIDHDVFQESTTGLVSCLQAGLHPGMEHRQRCML